MNLSLEDLGWSPFFSAVFEPHAREGLAPARIALASRERYQLLTPAGTLSAELAGRLRHEASSAADLPAAGDWVAVSPSLVHAVLPRRSHLARKEAGRGSAVEIVAANVDTIFVTTSLNRDLNVRRLERALSLVWDGGASPVIILTKSDLASPDLAAAAIEDVERIALAVPVHAVSALAGTGLDALSPYLTRGRTVALLGSSGVGKSTLLNRLAGRPVEATREIRASDDRGRHATTHRHLVPLPGGALLLDTPGLREMGLSGDEDLSRVFGDVEAAAQSCRFRDCAHRREPGCAVRATVAADRLESWRKLRREAELAEARREHAASWVEKRRWKTAMAQLRRTGSVE